MLSACHMRVWVLIEVLDPIDANAVICPTGFWEINYLFRWKRAVTVPALKVGFTYNYQIWRDDFIIWPYSLNCCNPFPITRLDLLCPTIAFRWGDNKGRQDLAHQKPCLIKVPDVWLKDPMFHDCVVKKVKPHVNYLWIFAFGPLVVIQTWLMYLEYWLPLYEAWSPAWSNVWCTMHLSKQVSHIFHHAQSWRKFLLIQVKDPLDNDLLL